MESRLMDSRVTVWRQGEGGFSRSVLGPAHVREADAKSFGSVQPLRSSGATDGLTAVIAGRVDVLPGDYVAAGSVPDPAPPEGCYRVESVATPTLMGRAHHTRVVAR